MRAATSLRRIQLAKEQLPTDIELQMGPISTGLGEIYMWTVDAKPGAKKADGSDYTPTDLREIQDWVINSQAVCSRASPNRRGHR